MENLENCHSLNDIARKLFNKANYTNRIKAKKYLADKNIDWQEWQFKNKKVKKDKYCIVCGKKLENEQVKFCSHSCAAKHNNTLRTKGLKTCINCGKVFKAWQKEQKYCCQDCQKEYQYNEYIDRWKKGLENGVVGKSGLSQRIKRYLFEKTNCSCEICGCNWVNPKSGKPIVEIHHKDGNAFNNAEDNLQVLCPNHHAMTETFKNNNSLGRTKRRKKDK